MSVEDALRELREGRDDKALELFLRAWIIGQPPSLAHAIGLISRRITAARMPHAKKMKDEEWLALEAKKNPADVGFLLDTLLTHRSVEALVRLEALEQRPPDPRIALALAQWTAKPPYQARTTRPFWEKVHTILQALSDPVSRDVLAAGRADYMKTLSSSAWAQDWFGKRADETLSVIPAHLGADPHVDVLAEVKRIVGDPDARVQKRALDLEPKKRELFDAVYDDPKDDSRRAVLGDWLLEQGDPRGEMIALQLQGGSKMRVRELLAEHWREWLDGVPLLKKELAFAKGFPDSGLAAGAAGLPAPSRSWATLRELRLEHFYPPPTEQIVAALTSPHVKSLVSVEGLRVADVFALTKRAQATPFERFVLLDQPGDPGMRDAILSRDVFPKLRELGFVRCGDVTLVSRLLVSRLQSFFIEQAVGAWRASFTRGSLVVEFQIFQETYWNSLLEILPAFGDVKPALTLKAENALSQKQRDFLQKALQPFASKVELDAPMPHPGALD